MPIGVVVSTHDLNFAAALCRTMVMLRDGTVIAAGATEDVLTPARTFGNSTESTPTSIAMRTPATWSSSPFDAPCT